MILALPVSSIDLHLAVPLVKWMREIGPYPRHECLLVYSGELTPEQRESVASEVRQMGWATPAKALTVNVQHQSWPEAPNQIFRETANFIEQAENLRKHWYFFEADNTPMRAGWLDALEDEYLTDLSKPIMGCVDATFGRMPDGTKVKMGQHLIGTSIYPPNLSLYTDTVMNNESFMGEEAFDLVMSRQIMERGIVRHTELIQGNWSTGSYAWQQKDNEWVIQCSEVQLRVRQNGESQNRDVCPGIAVLHGCKDGSLLRALKDGQPQQVVVPSAEPPPPVETNDELPFKIPFVRRLPSMTLHEQTLAVMRDIKKAQKRLQKRNRP